MVSTVVVTDYDAVKRQSRGDYSVYISGMLAGAFGHGCDEPLSLSPRAKTEGSGVGGLDRQTVLWTSGKPTHRPRTPLSDTSSNPSCTLPPAADCRTWLSSPSLPAVLCVRCPGRYDRLLHRVRGRMSACTVPCGTRCQRRRRS